MTGPVVAAFAQWTIIGLELAALATIAGGFGWSAGRSIICYLRGVAGRYILFRRELGRSTLIALELLVAADILRSLVLEPSLVNIAVLAALVAIRTFLSFSIDVELDGCWPWERAKIRLAAAGGESSAHCGQTTAGEILSEGLLSGGPPRSPETPRTECSLPAETYRKEPEK